MYLLLLVSVSFAWTNSAPPFTVYSVLGNNFTISDTGQSAIITVTTKDLYGWNSTLIFPQTATNFTVPAVTASNLYNYALPASGNYTGSYFHETATSHGLDMYCNNSSSDKISLQAVADAGTFPISINSTNNITYNVSVLPASGTAQWFNCSNANGGITITIS